MIHTPALLLSLLVPTFAHAASSSSSTPSSSVPTRLYALHVGVNDAPTGATALRFADDDAARFYRFTTDQGATAVVATIVDDESQQRHGEVAARAIVPDTQSLSEALAALGTQMAADRAAGHVVAFYFSYSGHGVDDGSGQVGLTLLDGVADQAWLVEHVLSVPADRIHLFIDACHAAGVVAGRGVIARDVEGSARVVNNDDGVRQFLRRHPHAGALIASPRGDVTHEWSRLQAGVFTHEVLSALSGAADVNNDGHVVYSEVAAFLAAANRDVVDERARLRAEVVAPRLDPRTVLSVVEPSSFSFVLSGRALSGHVVIEHADGVRLVDVHSDDDAYVQLALPANEPLVVKNNHQVAQLQSNRGVRWDELRFVDDGSDDVGERGVASALAEGLFAAPFGRAYYIGYVDSRGLPAEAFSSSPANSTAIGGAAITSVNTAPPLPIAAIAGFAIGGVGLVGAVGAGLWAMQEYTTATTSPYQRPATEAGERFPIAVGAAAVGAAIAVAGVVVGGLSVP